MAFEFDASTAKPDDGAFDPTTAKIDKPSAARRLGDVGISLAKGVIGVPEAAVGLADLVTGGHAGKAAEGLGFRPKEAKAILSDYYSPQQKAANAEVDKADGFIPTLGAMVQNPSTIVNTVAESAPSMLGGGAAARGILKVAPKIGGIGAAAMGEGLVGAGQSAEQIRQETSDGLLTGKQAALAGASGALTGAISLGAGRLADKLGIGDIDTQIATGKLGAGTQTNKGLARKTAEGVLSEGVLEEMPQSAQEQIAQNLALNKPWDEGVSKATAQGLLAGGFMGAGGAAEGHFGEKTLPVEPVLPTPTPEFQPVLPTPVPIIQPTPVPKSEQMGIDPNAGVLSKAAAMAVDTGAHEQTLQAAQVNQPETAKTATKAPEIAPETQSNLIAEQPINTSARAEISPENTPIYGSAYAQRQATAPKVEQNDILDTNGQPFVTGFSAKRAAEAAGEGFRPFKVGEKQFVVRNFATENIADKATDTTATPEIEAKNAPQAKAQTVEAGTPAGAAGAQPAATPAKAGTSLLETAGVSPTNSTNSTAVQSVRETLTREIETGMTDVTGAPLGKFAIQQRKYKLKQLNEKETRAQTPQAVEIKTQGQAPAVPKSVNVVPYENRVNAADDSSNRTAAGSGSAVPAGLVLPERSGSDLQTRPEVVSKDAEKADLAGEKLNKEWTAFTPESGTLNVPRAEMPQIKAEHRGAMVNFLKARGIESTTEDVAADSLKPTQTEFSPAKVAQAKGFTGGDRSILVSNDGHVLDGHHQWLAKREAGEAVKVIKLNAPIKDLLATVKEFPSAAQSSGAIEAKPTPPGLAKMQAAKTAKEAEIAAKQRADHAKAEQTRKDRTSRLTKMTHDKSPFLGFLGKHGINIAEKREFSPDKNPMLSGYGPMFRKNGLPVDQLIQRAVEEGYLPPGTNDDVKLRDLITQQMSGKNIAPMYTEDGAENAMQAEIDRRAQFEEDDAFEALSGNTYTTQELDALDDIPWDTGTSAKETTRQAMQAMGFSEQEIQDAITNEEARARETSQDGSRSSQTEASQPQESDSAPAREEGLTAPTRAGLLAQQDRAAQAEKDKAAADKAADKAAKQAADKKEIDARQEASVENSQLGQSAEDSGKLIIANASSKIEAKPVKADDRLTEPMIARRANPGNMADKSFVATAFIKEGDIAVEGVGAIQAEALANLSKDADEYLDSAKNVKKVDLTLELSEKTQALNLLSELQAKQDANGMIGDDRLESQINQLKKRILSIDEANGQNDELGAETRSYEAKASPTYSGEPKSDALNEKEKAAKAKMLNALGKLATLASKNTRMNWTPEEEQKLLPIVIELFDGAMELGAVTFQKAVRYVRDYIAKGIDQETADAIPFDTLQGAYIATSGRHKDKGITPKKEVASFDSLAELDAEEKSNTTLTDTFYEAIKSGGMPKDNPALRKMVESFDGKPADNARLKEAQEELEAAIARTTRDVIAKNEGRRTTFDVLLRLYNSQPLLNIRTSTSIANQAYSTPAPLAYLASELAGITQNDTVLEPTGGTGMLIAGANPSKTLANELNGHRAELLRAQGFTVTQDDAANGFKGAFDKVTTNPPFGSVKDEKGNPIKVQVDGYRLGQIDHLIAARALAAMKDDGKATLILGANKVAGGISNDDLIFFNWLYGHYNVTGHFEVEGDLYARQGAGWPVRVISINGRQKSNKTSPIAGTVKRADNWNQVYEYFTDSLATSRTEPNPSATTSAGGIDTSEANASAVSGNTDGQPTGANKRQPAGSTGDNGDVTGTTAGAVPDRAKPAKKPVGASADSKRLNTTPAAPDRLDTSGDAAGSRADKPATSAGASSLSSGENQFQSSYIPRSLRKDEGVLIPVNMKEPTQDALSKLEDAVGNIDDYAVKELGYANTKELHDALMGLQVDSVASAIYQIKQGKGVVIADQTGIGKGRQAAAIIRWAAKQGHTPVFVTVKPSLFTDMYGDLADIGTNDINPFIMNGSEWISSASGEKLFSNKPLPHKNKLSTIAATGELPAGSNALFMTYSQINVDNVQRKALTALADKAVFILDESHNAGGASATGEFITSVLGAAKGVTYLSATYAKRPDNMPLYFKTDIGQASADNEGLMAAMAAGGLPLQTVVSNNLVKAGQMFRRERSYDGVSIESKTDSSNQKAHEALSDKTTAALRAIVAADAMFHEVYVKELSKQLAKEGGRAIDNAGNQAQDSVQHTEFSSVVHNFVRQMLLGLKAQSAADDAIAALKRGEKPIIAVENTMGSFLSEYAAANGVTQGGSLGSFDYRTVLSRALARTRVMTEQKANGEKVKKEIPLSALDGLTQSAYAQAQDVIDGLDLDIPVSPIDWMRTQIQKAGYSVAEITGRSLSVDYSSAPVLSAISAQEQNDKVQTTRLFNSGKLDALILNVAGSTGISLHASEKFTDQRQRHMIVAQPAQDINIFMQMLGRIHRTGQVKLPKYTILSVDLPTEKRPTALLSKKMKSLNANTSSNTESATSVKTADMLNKYGDQIVGQYLHDNYHLTQALGLDGVMDGDEAVEDIARKATGRLALQPISVQNAFYSEVEGQYNALLDYLNKTNQNDLEPRTFDFDAKELKQEVLFEGADKNTPFGEDAIYGEYSIKAQGLPMKPVEINAEIQENLSGKTSEAHVVELGGALIKQFEGFFKTLPEGAQQETANKVLAEGKRFLQDHRIGKTFRVDINGDSFNAVVTNIRSTHKTTGNPLSLSKVQVSIAVNGALRHISVPATQFQKIEVSSIGEGYTVEQLFKEQPADQRETTKIVTGNLLAAYGEIDGARGTIISFTKADGTTEQGILLPKTFDFTKNTRGDFRLSTGAIALKFLQESDNKDIGRFGIMSRDSIVRVLPNGNGIAVQVPKSKLKGGKYFLDQGLIGVLGDFVTAGNYMKAITYNAADAINALELLMKKQALYALPSMAEEAKAIADKVDTRFSRGQSTTGLSTSQVKSITDAIKSKWVNAPEIVIAANMDDKAIPQAVRDHNDGQLSQGAEGSPEGFLYEGKVYLVADQLATPKDVMRVLFHETLGHVGLRGVFGDSLTPILKQVAMFRKAEVAAKAKEYGLDMNIEAERLQAAEEVLAVMAQDKPDMGFVKRAIAAIRTWLRAHGVNLRLTDGDIIANYILPARAWVQSGKTSNFDASNPDIRFSRSTAASLTKTATDKLNENFSVPGKLSWWHKSFGTMNNLAERSPAFKPVFEAAQNFINDTSYYATEAADMAGKILPKLENWRDLGKSPISATDNKAISAPIFEGTLSWARDESGKPVKLDELEARYKDLTPKDKADMLLKKRIVTEDQLKRWMASPLDIYEGAVNNRFESTFLKAGVLWTDAELKSIFNQTPEQISLYKEFRAATDKSLDNMAKAEMLRFGGKDVVGLKDAVMDAKDADEAGLLLRDYLLGLAETDAKRSDSLMETANGMIDRADKATKLKAEGYAPLSRFGKYSVDVVVDGERQYFGLHESMRDANIMAMKMKAEYGAANVSQGTLSESQFKLFAGITPESLELFGNMLGLDSTGNEAQDQAFQNYLKLTKTNRSALRRMIHRKGIAGFSEDAGRVLASFVYSNARNTAAALNMGNLGESINAIPKEQGELKDAAIALAEYIKNPQEEAQAIRGLLFAQYLGGSVASAFVNLTQPFAVTFPWLSQFGGAKQSGAQLVRAMKDMAGKNTVYEPDLAKALHHAEEMGIVSPQEVHQLMAQARGAGTLRSGDGTKLGDVAAKASNALSKLSLGWGKVFGMAEQLNRRSTFIAAYRIAKLQNMANPAAFAEKAVNETQFVYSKANKMKFGRGAVGGTLMTFKTYSIAYLELLHRMYTQGGPEGKKAVLLALGVMMLMSGSGGLPFEDDILDLVDGLLQKLGYNISTKKAKQQFFEDLFGKAGADFVERGISGLPGMPLDVSGRMGMGNLIPGTGLFMQKTDHTRDVAELAGPMGDMVKRGFDSAGKLLTGDVGNAALGVAPTAIRNAAKGAEMGSTGQYKDAKGYKVIETTPLEAALKAIGFQPATVAKVQESVHLTQQSKDFYNQQAADIRARWAKGISEKDPEQVKSARDDLQAWNEKNPDQKMVANLPAIWKKVREMNKTKEQRLIDTAPKSMRLQLKRDLMEARAE